MAKKAFPNFIHVTREQENSGDAWLQVHENGVGGVEQHGTQIAIYKLVEVGTVNILKSFTNAKKKR